MRLNIYNLCEEKINKGSLKVFIGVKLRGKIRLALHKLKKKNMQLKFLAEDLGLGYASLWRNLNKDKFISLLILKKLEEFTSVNLQNDIVYLYSPHSKTKIKIPKKVNFSLAKLIGCILADGHLRKRKTERGQHYELVIREGHKTNMEAAQKWFENFFEFIPKLHKKDNHYFIYVSNKIIFSYFTKMLSLPTGKKSEKISTPLFILKGNQALKQAYLQGLFMFDGGVDFRTGYVNYTSKSEKLIKEIMYMLLELGLKPDFVSALPDKYRRYRLRFRKREKLERCLFLFQKHSEKWWRLSEHLYGLSGTTKDLKMVSKSMNKYYPKVRDGAITFGEVISALESLDDEATIVTLSKRLKRNKTVVYEFLSKLEQWQIVRSYRVGLRKHYTFKNKLRFPRR